MNNQEAIVHFEGRDYPASEWLKLICGNLGHVAMVDVRADGNQRYDASDARRLNNHDHAHDDCSGCGHPDGQEVEIEGKVVYLHPDPECEAAYRQRLKIKREVMEGPPSWL